MFTRKHYNEIALHHKTYTAILKHSLTPEEIDHLDNYIISFALTLERDNPNFKRDLFLKACGL